MEFQEYSFGTDDIGRRLDRIIRRFLPDYSLSEIYGLIRKGLIKINLKKTKENVRINEGDILYIADFINSNKSKKLSDALNSKNIIDIDSLIVFKNQDILILNKPYDTKVHGDNNSLDYAVRIWFEKNIKNDSLSFKPGPLHRLDRKTTGLLAFSLSLKGAKWFSENIENHNIKKTYLGICD